MRLPGAQRDRPASPDGAGRPGRRRALRLLGRLLAAAALVGLGVVASWLLGAVVSDRAAPLRGAEPPGRAAVPAAPPAPSRPATVTWITGATTDSPTNVVAHATVRRLRVFRAPRADRPLLVRPLAARIANSLPFQPSGGAPSRPRPPEGRRTRHPPRRAVHRRRVALVLRRHGRRPLVLLATAQRGAWVKVLLPTRPNGSTGWVRLRDVRLVIDEYRMEIDLRRRQISVWRGFRLVQRNAIGVGAGGTPTPTGLFYLTELIRPPTPDTVYGRYAFALSAFSDRLQRFDGGYGQAGIHGTNDPATIGQRVSHGCIRMTNAHITRLARIVPLGTPVVIRG